MFTSDKYLIRSFVKSDVALSHYSLLSGLQNEDCHVSWGLTSPLMRLEGLQRTIKITDKGKQKEEEE